MDLKALTDSIVAMNDQVVRDLVKRALSDHIDPKVILDQGLIPGIKEVGSLFSRKEYFVPEVLLAAEAFYAGFDIIKPLLESAGVKKKGKIMIAVVEGDIHDIGKNIVKVMLEASGYDVNDLGRDVSVNRIIKSVKACKPQILALSSLMTTTMNHMEDVIKILEEEGIRSQVKVIVGGAPVNRDFAERIKADGYGCDAAEAVKITDTIING
ncbi:hypothetical protein A2Y85_06630 [candidate division WOR-3 bacterium RBG_13_43_14]|uniref:Methyltransferase n=1 Tax=candidate division WOR-3 bacterium RBG_13_43_14 TaxID=1802590 RepID=A0A1F4UGD8_UNCW3|nr:MAG: hypothetical protein A2Y85_06630 [candidate division WOR-3 bacterium RBG_13_43_14]